ncbi:MAG: DUF4190 domain-containing protein [Planctomycetes bacterium]|nr:DUF4190 domain-containing protein [Planctomycetota bacterium]
MPPEQLTVIMPDGRTFGPTDLATVIQWLSEGRVPDAAMIRDEATGQQHPASSYRASALQGVNPFSSPAGMPTPQDDTTSTLIPYRNPPALTAYYLGVFSLSACIPLLGVVGVVMAIAAVVCGVRGLRLAKENPQARGRVHAWIGIVCGSVFAVLGIPMQIMSIIGLIAAIIDK